MTTLSSTGKAVAPRAVHSTSGRAFLSEQLVALSRGKSITPSRDAFASQFLQTVQALPKLDFKKSKFYLGLSLMVKDELIPLSVFQSEKTFNTLLAIHDKLFSQMSEQAKLCYFLMPDCPVGKEGLTFFHLLFHNLGNIKRLPATLMDWEFAFYVIATFNDAAERVDFWMPHHAEFNAIDLDQAIRHTHLMEIRSVLFVLQRSRTKVKPPMRIVLRFAQIFSAHYQDRSKFNRVLSKYFNEVYPLLVKKLGEDYFGVEYSTDFQSFVIWFSHQRYNNQFTLLCNTGMVYPSNPVKDFVENRDVALYQKDANFSSIAILPFAKVIQYLPSIVWENMNSFSMHLLLHLAAGNNIRTSNLEFPLTKKMAHHFHTLEPATCSLDNLYLYCLVKSMGGDIRLVALISRWFVIRVFDNIPSEYTVENVKRFEIILKKMIEWNILEVTTDVQQITIINFVSHIIRDLPQFNINGRTLASFLRLAEEHQANFEESRFGYKLKLKWGGAGYANFETRLDAKDYQIVQLKTSFELEDESKALRHCVASYARHCYAGNCSIWSLRVKLKTGKWKSLVTIEVDQDRNIIQTKGSCNINPSLEYLTIIKDWADREQLITRGF